MQEAIKQIVEKIGVPNAKAFFNSIANLPTTSLDELIEYSYINFNYQQILAICERNEGCEELLNQLQSDSHRNPSTRSEEFPPIVLSEDIKKQVVELVDRSLHILKDGVDYNSGNSPISDTFKDFCYRFNRIKEGLNK